MTESFKKAEASLTEGNRLIASSDYREANRVLMSGISALGGSYYWPAAMDASDLKLATAEAEEHAGRVNTAANLRVTVLTTTPC